VIHSASARPIKQFSSQSDQGPESEFEVATHGGGVEAVRATAEVPPPDGGLKSMVTTTSHH
jgi:hypothetical protein